MDNSDLNRTIHEHSTAMEYRQQSLRAYYTRRGIVIKIGPVGFIIIGVQLLALVFFCMLYVFSFIPQTKSVVAMVLP